MVGSKRPSDHITLDAMLNGIGSVSPALVRLFRFRIDKIQRDEKDAVVSAEWARRMREQIASELDELAERPGAR